MTMDEELANEEYMFPPPSPPSPPRPRASDVTCRTTNTNPNNTTNSNNNIITNNNRPRDLSFDLTETSDHSLTAEEETPSSSLVVRNSGASGKILLLFTATVALLGSIYATLSCKFLLVQRGHASSISSFVSSSSSSAAAAAAALFANSNTTTTAIGIFSYSPQGSTIHPWDLGSRSTCIPYEYQFWESDFGPLFWTAQLAALLAPSVGGLALLIQCLEIMVQRHFLQNFLLVVFLYLMASLIQGYTFAIYGVMDFCWGKDEFHCSLSESGYASVVAAACYYLCVILMCFLPRQSMIPRMETSSSSKNRHHHHHHHYPSNKTVVTEDPTASQAGTMSILEEGQRSVRFEDPPVSQTLMIQSS